MKKMNESRLLVTMVFGLMLGLLIVHPYNVMAAKPAGKDKKEVEANITHVHHLTLRGAYSEMPYTSLNPTALVMGGSLNMKSYFKLADHLEDLAKRPGTIEDLLIELFEGGALQIETVTEHHRDIVGRVQSIAFTNTPEDRDRRFHAAFENFLRSCREDGRLRPDVPIEVLADVVSSTYSAMSLSWVHFDDYPVRERAAATARFLAQSLDIRRNPREEIR